jgi:uncharacterized protein (DUF1330 family)
MAFAHRPSRRVYAIAENDATDIDAYMKEFVPKVRPTIIAAGGRPLAASTKVTPEGEAPKSRVTISQWDSLEKYQAWRNSLEYKEARKIGESTRNSVHS